MISSPLHTYGYLRIHRLFVVMRKKNKCVHCQVIFLFVCYVLLSDYLNCEIKGMFVHNNKAPAHPNVLHRENSRSTVWAACIATLRSIEWKMLNNSECYLTCVSV